MASTSTEIAIHPHKHKDGTFSAPGDSENIIIDRLGRTVDLFIGGSVAVTRLNSTDVTYDMPCFWIEEQIKKAFPYSYLYPIKEYGREIDTTTSRTLVRHLVPFSLTSPYLTSSLPSRSSVYWLVVSADVVDCSFGSSLSFSRISSYN